MPPLPHTLLPSFPSLYLLNPFVWHMCCVCFCGQDNNIFGILFAAVPCLLCRRPFHTHTYHLNLLSVLPSLHVHLVEDRDRTGQTWHFGRLWRRRLYLSHREVPVRLTIHSVGETGCARAAALSPHSMPLLMFLLHPSLCHLPISTLFASLLCCASLHMGSTSAFIFCALAICIFCFVLAAANILVSLPAAGTQAYLHTSCNGISNMLLRFISTRSWQRRISHLR